MRQDESGGGLSRIKLRNLQRAAPIDLAALQSFAETALKLCLRLRRRQSTRLRKLPEISILFISDRRMTALHRAFLQQKGSTDVITFAHGEIFISVATAKQHAQHFGNPLLRELQLYIVHGLLHLHGFDDRNTSDARRMEAIQETILAAALRA